MLNDEPAAGNQFSIRWLLLLVTSVALILAHGRWQGRVAGSISAIPAVLTVGLLFATRGRTAVGIAVGSSLAAICWAGWVGVAVMPTLLEPRQLKAAVLFAMIGASLGGGIHAVMLGRRALGWISLVLLIVFFWWQATRPHDFFYIIENIIGDW